MKTSDLMVNPCLWPSGYKLIYSKETEFKNRRTLNENDQYS